MVRAMILTHRKKKCPHFILVFIKLKCGCRGKTPELHGCFPIGYTGKLCHSEEQWQVPLDATAASARVERGGWADMCNTVAVEVLTMLLHLSLPLRPSNVRYRTVIYDKHGFDPFSLPQSFPKCHLSLYGDFFQMQMTVAGIVLCRPLFDIQLPRCTNAPLILLSPLW